MGSIREPGQAPLLLHRGLILTGFRETPGSDSEQKFKDNCSMSEHETAGKVRISGMTYLTNVTLTQAAQSKCNYGKVGQEWTDESDADQSSSSQNTCYLKSRATRPKLGFQLSL